MSYEYYENSDICKDRILILDFGSQYTQLIARRIRELGVYCEVSFFWNVEKTFIRTFNPSGIILSGSPNSVNCYLDKKDFILRQGTLMQYMFQFDIPILGICYGMQAMIAYFGGRVVKDLSRREFGRVRLSLVAPSVLTNDIYDYVDEEGHHILDVWMSHSETVISVPQGFVVIGITKDDNIAIVVNEKKNLYGVQFHPEVTHTIQGRRILERFIFEICSCNSLWKISNIVSYLVTYIRNLVQDDVVMLAFSGGIDSFVTALLLQRAIGSEKLMCYFVDSGLLRDNECSYVKKFAYAYSLNIRFLFESNRFFNALVGVKDPEEKRKIIGRVFIEVFEECRKNLSCKVVWLAQGTIYPDIIESGFCNSFTGSVIKSHHNVGGLPNIGTMRLLEPIKNLFKDEVRKIGRELGISCDILCRHPFPGPGLAIRVLGEVREEYCSLLREADGIFIEELCKYDLYHKISQAFVVFLPVRSVGIMGDVRKYEWVVALRVVETIDFMTASWVYLSYDFLSRVSNRIIAEVSGISRVVYDISSKPPSTIEWE